MLEDRFWVAGMETPRLFLHRGASSAPSPPDGAHQGESPSPWLERFSPFYFTAALPTGLAFNPDAKKTGMPGTTSAACALKNPSGRTPAI